MKLNSPIGTIEVPDFLESFPFRATSEADKCSPHRIESDREILWYRNNEGKVKTVISTALKDRVNRYSCECGYTFDSGIKVPSIRCYACGELMSISNVEDSGSEENAI